MSRNRTAAAAGSKRKAPDADVMYSQYAGVSLSGDLVNGNRLSLPVLRPIVTDPRNFKCSDPSEPEFKSIRSDNLQKGCFVLDSAEIQLLAHEEEVYLSNAEAECGCETPKSEEHKIPKILSCPPPPKKSKPVAKKNMKASAASFFIPPDLNSIFLPQNFQGQVS